MSYTPKNAASVEFSDDRERNIEKLRRIEQQFNWRGDEWHYALVHHIDEPIKVYSFFRNARKVGEKIYFDASTDNGKSSYQWVEKKLMGNLLKAFGKVEICLATNGEVIRSFNPYEKEAA